MNIPKMRMESRQNPVNRRTRIRIAGFAPVVCLLLLVAFAAPAFCVEFVTQEAFSVERNPYKDYPFRVLFKKLHESSDAEKIRIRNVIILKQVFEGAPAEAGESTILPYSKIYGVIKELDRDSLRIWDPENDTFRDLFVGIDRIPLVNKDEYEVSDINIDRYAAVAYVLDSRIYKIEIAFELVPPSGLTVKQKGTRNLVQWTLPALKRPPTAFQVFVNGKLFKTVKTTNIEVPRSREQADEYYVKAVYRHNNGQIASAASDTLFDQTTATVLAAKGDAEKCFDQISAALAASDWSGAKRLLYENRAQLTEHLSREDAQRVNALTGYFKDLDEGDRLGGVSPANEENLDMARGFYLKAKEKLNGVENTKAMAGVADARIAELASRKTALAKASARKQAQTIFEKILLSLNASDWKTARQMLTEQRTMLTEQLPEDQKRQMMVLTGFFADLDEADRLAGLSPQTDRNMDAARAMYLQARKKLEGIPAGSAMTGLTTAKISKLDAKKSALDKAAAKQQAEEVFKKILLSVNASDWKTARKLLAENRAMLSDRLEENRKRQVLALTGFFGDLDEGDRLAAVSPAKAENLDKARGVYLKAKEKVKGIQNAGAMAGLADAKISELDARKTALAKASAREQAQATFEKIRLSLNASDWKTARQMLTEHRTMLSEQLPEDQKRQMMALTGFFADLDEGDRLAGLSPETDQNMETARAMYLQAQKKLEGIPAGSALTGLTTAKISELDARKSALERAAAKQQAEKVFNDIFLAVNASDWKTARKLLAENRAMLSDRLEENGKRQVLALTGFFGDLDEGDRLAAVSPANAKNLDKAGGVYRKAKERVKGIQNAGALIGLADVKISELEARNAALAEASARKKAQGIFEKILLSLDASDWKTARQLLNDHRAMLAAQLGEDKKRQMMALTGFWANLDEGDRLAGLSPESDKNLDAAREMYQKAEKQSEKIPAVGTLAGLTVSKMAEVDARKSALSLAALKKEAESTFRKIVLSLNVTEWTQARELLYAERAMLMEHLNEERKQYAMTLTGFFKELDEGDRIQGKRPETVENLDLALNLYQSAEKKAAALPPAMDVASIVRLRMVETNSRKDLLISGEQKKLAVRTYEGIVSALKANDWARAEKMLADNRKLLDEHLDAGKQVDVRTMSDIFDQVRKGDKIAGQGAGAKELDSAGRYFGQAQALSARLSSAASMDALIQNRLDGLEKRRQKLEANLKEKQADEVYRKVLASMTPSGWTQARSLVLEDKDLLTANLAADKKNAVISLSTFFASVDAADKKAARQPSDTADLDAAKSLYQEAANKAKASLGSGPDVEFITDLKIAQLESRKSAIQAKNQKEQAKQIWAGIVGSLKPGKWQTARQQLTDQRLLLLDHLDRSGKEAVLGLVEMFRDIEEGDRYIGAAPESMKNFEMAANFYQRAKTSAKSIAGTVDTIFIAEEKLAENDRRKNALRKRQATASAEKVYEEILDGLTPDSWQKSKKRLAENRELLASNLEEPGKSNAARLVDFFKDLDEGDKTSGEKPVTEETLENAAAAYNRALDKAKAFEPADVLFLAQARLDEITARMEELKAGQLANKAGSIYNELLSMLTPDNWEKAKKQLEDNRPLLSGSLSDDKRQTVENLSRFFEDIAAADTMGGSDPETRENLDGAISLYQQAEANAQALSGVADLTVVTQERIQAVEQRKAAMETKRKQQLAEKTYDEVIAAISPETWENAQTAALGNLKLLVDYLDEEKKATARLLVDFFMDISEGERMGATQPESEASYAEASALFQQAGEKAIALTDRVDVMFIVEQKTAEIDTRKADFIAAQQAAAAAQQQAVADAAAAPVLPQAQPQAVPQAQDTRQLPSPSMLKLAMRNFNSGKYAAAFKLFQGIYAKQVGNLQAGGKKQVFGLLGLPPEIRAEVLFLVQLDKAVRANREDPDMVREGVLNIYDSIQTGRGPWAIIPETKKSKIMRHIDQLNF